MNLRIQEQSHFRDLRRLACLLALLVALFCDLRLAHAQYGFEAWTVDNGLPENEIRGITQTPDGYLWIATFNGLVRFDGVHITVFNKKTPGLSSNQFGSMVQGKGGELWIHSTDSGPVRYSDGKFRPYGKESGIQGDVVKGFTRDDNGNVWAAADGHILRWNEASDHFIDIAPHSPSLPYVPLIWDQRGFWVRQQDKLHCFTSGRFVDYLLPAYLLKESIWGAALDQDGNLWVETTGGKQVRITQDNVSHAAKPGSAQNMTAIHTQSKSWPIGVGPRLTRTFEFVSSNRTVSIMPINFLEDGQGNLWIGTRDQGLYRLQKQSILSYSKEQGLIDRDVFAIYQDHSAAVWIGAWHSGLSRFADGKFTNYTMADGLQNELVTALFEDREGRFWVGTHGGLSIFDQGRFRNPEGPILPSDAVVLAICQDRQGTLWFGTRKGLARYQNGVTHFFTREDGLASNEIHVIVEGLNGDLWVGTSGGLTRIRNGQFSHWTEEDGLPSKNIWSIYEDSDGVLWIGTYDGGLARLQRGKFTNYSVKDGLFDDGVFTLLEDSHGYLWISCSRGIYRVNKRDLNAFALHEISAFTSVAYGKIDGMLTVQCNGGVWPSGIRTRNGKLWFPTRDGVAIIDPESITHDQVPPSVMIESSVVDNTLTPVSGPLQIPPGKSNVEINYTALSFNNAAQTRYKYKLEGLDLDWVNAGGRRVAYYSHLPPRDYVFHVIAANSEGIWNNEGKALAITVLAPFYETWWFEMLVLLAIAALVTMAWRYRMSQLQQAQAAQQAFSRQLIASQESERKRIAAEMHDSLGQRLIIIKNLAHFLLRSRKDLPADSPDVQSITEISDIASSAIEETREISYNLRPFQLDRLGLTKAIQGMLRTAAKASGAQITSELDDIDDVFPDDLRINFYRIVQESMGNIMKHAQATEIIVAVKRGTKNVTLTIEDNGRGFAPDARNSETSRSGFGLAGMSERASLLGGEFKIRSMNGAGTTIRVEIPLKSKQ